MSEVLRSPAYGEADGEYLMVVNSDLELRHAVASESLELDSSSASSARMAGYQTELVNLLRQSYGDCVLSIDALKTREVLNEMLNRFKQEAAATGKRPIVLSLDPVIIDPNIVDYTFQESRASLITPSHTVVNLEHNPRGYTNRFINLAAQSNGAGKTAAQQLEELHALIEDGTDTRIALAIVEDYIHSGSGILGRFRDFIDNPDIEVHIFSGILNEKARHSLQNVTRITAVSEISQVNHLRRMDMSDILPTLGGRPVGVRDTTSLPNTFHPLLTTETKHGVQVPVAVDAICGDYPWQVDIYKSETSPEALHSLGGLALRAAKSFWIALENASDISLTWQSLEPLNGHLKTHYPINDLVPAQSIPQASSTPLEAVAAIEDRYNRYG